jgi:hypothetical protein
MNIYYYCDNSKKQFQHGAWLGICVCVNHAESILESDKMFQEKLGSDPTKNKYIGCKIVFDKAELI